MSDLTAALAVLRSGGVIVLPTDTVYGVGVSVSAPGAIETLFELKGRPADKPIPVLGADVAALRQVVDFDDRAGRIGERFWPGPLTLVLPRAAGFSVDLGGEGAEGRGRRGADPGSRTGPRAPPRGWPTRRHQREPIRRDPGDDDRGGPRLPGGRSRRLPRRRRLRRRTVVGRIPAGRNRDAQRGTDLAGGSVALELHPVDR